MLAVRALAARTLAPRALARTLAPRALAARFRRALYTQSLSFDAHLDRRAPVNLVGLAGLQAAGLTSADWYGNEFRTVTMLLNRFMSNTRASTDADFDKWLGTRSCCCCLSCGELRADKLLSLSSHILHGAHRRSRRAVSQAAPLVHRVLGGASAKSC